MASTMKRDATKNCLEDRLSISSVEVVDEGLTIYIFIYTLQGLHLRISIWNSSQIISLMCKVNITFPIKYEKRYLHNIVKKHEPKSSNSC